MVLFTCTALRFKQPTTISFASLTSLSRERRRQKKLSPGKKATQNRLDWVLESPECVVASSTKRNDRLSNACLKIPVSETKEYAHWNQHAQFTKLRFYVDSVHNKLHKGDESFYMQVQDGCVELRDRSRTAIKEVKTGDRVKLEPGWLIKFHDAGELRVLRNINAHA